MLILVAGGQPAPKAQSVATDLIVASFLSDTVIRYDGQTGVALEVSASDALDDPGGVAIGSDGGLYVVGQASHNVVRFDAETGEFIDEFVTRGSGGLSFPTGIVIGADGHLYVASLGTHQVLRYDGRTGAFIDAFVATASGGLERPVGLTFGAEGHLYVTGSGSNNVLRYNGHTGAFIDVFASGGGLNSPTGLAFGPDSHLYVASTATATVQRYNGATGAFVDTFVPAGSGGLNNPTGIIFGPDGNLYVANSSTNQVLRYDGTSGTFLDAFVSAGPEGLSFPTFLAFRPSPGVIFFSAGERAKGSLAFGDFNGDGFPDLAMGSAEQNVGSVGKAGAVTVVYGTVDGLRSTGSQTWHEDSPGVDGSTTALNKFGRALAAGDFDGDGFDDLAIGIPGADFAFSRDAGAVVILYGSARISATLPGGLQTMAGRPSQRWTQFRLSGSGADESGDRFGAALVAANFNGDVNSTTGLPIDDLAIGVPGEDDSAGAVAVMYGSRFGLIESGADVWSQGSPGIEGDFEGDDRFGSALAAGNFDGDRHPTTGLGFDDLAVGVPGEDTGIYFGADAGAVNIIRGSVLGLTAENNQAWSQDTDGIGEDADRDDEFGSSLAAGDFNGDRLGDLAIGAPSEDYGTIFGPLSLKTRVDRGVVHVIFGTSSGLDAADDQVIRDELTLPERGEFFGFALAAADFTGDGRDDLAVGIPGSGEPAKVTPAGTFFGTDEGRVLIHVGRSGTGGLVRGQSFAQDLGLQGDPEDGDDFGAALAAADLGDPRGNQRRQLAVFVNDGDSGAANVIYGGADGLDDDGNQQWFCGPDGVAGINEHWNAGSVFDVLVDGRFSNTPGEGEWSDVPSGAFVSDPGNSQVVQATESDSSTVNSLFFAAVAAGSGGSTGASSLSVMFAYLPKTSAGVQPGERLAEITFPIVLEAGRSPRPVTVRLRAAAVSGVASSAAMSGSSSQFEAVVDLNGDGRADMLASALGIEAASDFGPSPLSTVPHLLVEMRLPLQVPAGGFAADEWPLPDEGAAGVYRPEPAFWTARFARDDQPPGTLTPGSGALLRVHPDGALTVNAGVVPELAVAVDIKPDGPRNRIDLRSTATVPVAVFSSARFDATRVRHDLIAWHSPIDLSRFARPVRHTNADVDRDGYQDRIFFFRVSDLVDAGVLSCTSTAGVIVGRTPRNNRTFGGADALRIAGCDD